MLGNSLEIRKKYIKKLEKKQADLNDGYALLKKLDAKIMRQNGGAAPVDLKALQASMLAARVKASRNTVDPLQIRAATDALTGINDTIRQLTDIVRDLQTQVTDIIDAIQPVNLNDLNDAVRAVGVFNTEILTDGEKAQLLGDLTARTAWNGAAAPFNNTDPYMNGKIGEAQYNNLLALL